MKAAVMGYGTIGSGVVEILEVNRDVIAKRVGEPVDVKYVLDLREFEGDPIQEKIVHDYKTIAEDPEVAIVVETMGGVEPAFTFVKAMLEAGKHVTTSNKALVADKGAELIAIARDHGVNFEFEASVGGGIPIIRPLLQCLTGDVIEEIKGIVNGTTNYMMTRMMDEGMEFDDVLKEAQAKGYAEKDPTADIEGYDACRKIAILTSLVAEQQVNYEEIPTEGITKISATDMLYAKEMDRAIKLLATSEKIGDTYSLRVAPYLVAKDHPLYSVNDVFNAVFVRGNMLGDGMFYGSGAGKLPTASAVVGDVVEMARRNENIPLNWDPKPLALADPSLQENVFFVRCNNTAEEIAEVFGKVTFIASQAQSEEAFITEKMTEGEFEEKAAKVALVNRIRLA